MHGLIDYHGTQEAITGAYPGLLALTRQLVGERLLFARRGYPDELKLHFGEASTTPGPKGRTLTRGSYVLGAVASAWSFKMARQGVMVYSGDLFGQFAPANQPWFSPLPEDRLDELLATVSGLTVVGVDVQAHPFGYALALFFSEGSALLIVPTAELEATAPNGKVHPAVPDWELFTPYNRFLRVGPGPKWAYLPSDQLEASGEAT